MRGHKPNIHTTHIYNLYSLFQKNVIIYNQTHVFDKNIIFNLLYSMKLSFLNEI